ncbi:unnamed protein product [Adineta steineri]|uniref:Uncharacterized protein n=1 Tax=Adineta steineri TaxID=433720 RepID=A0A815WZQ3_9BILA|nr:unnamed protein product [Adineta steineri]CAF1549932.1 unnamed protein product [Adineta steineri]
MPLHDNKSKTSSGTIEQITSVFKIDAEALKLDPKTRQTGPIVKEFSLNTSMHGIPGIARSESIHNRLFWTVSFLIYTGIMFYFIIQAIREYFKYPTQTSVDFVGQWPQVFPAVTFCNYSPIRYDRFIESFTTYTNSLNLTNLTDSTPMSPTQALYIDGFLQDKLNRNESLIDFYFSLESMLVKCTYNGVNCSVTDFIQFTSPVYGLCYTFNAQAKHINNGEVHYNNEHGDSGELELGLYTHGHMYVPFISDGIGVVAMVHDNTQLPLIDRLNTQLVPGRKYKLGYSKKVNYLLPPPYTTCNDKVPPGLQAMFDQFEGITYAYAQELCFKVALQTYTYDECGCVSPYEWAARYIIPTGTNYVVHARLCDASDSCYSDAADRFRDSDSISLSYGAACGLECTTNEFVVKLSAIATPAQWYSHEIRKFVETSAVPVTPTWNETWLEDIRLNYVGIAVVCESTRVEVYTQQATITAVDVISNVGGQTGLWIGISFLSLMEIAEMIYRIIRHQCHCIRNKLVK